MNERDSVSVVVHASANAEGLLDLASSVLPQLGEGDEVLIVVDPVFAGTPDNLMGEVVEEIARQTPLVRVLVNEGQSSVAAYEQAISVCKGSCVFLATPGDIWMPDKVSSTLDAFAMSGSVLVAHDAEVYDIPHQIMAPSMFAARGNPVGSGKGGGETSFQDWYPASCLAFLEPLRRLVLPVPPEVTRFDQWLGIVAQRFGGLAVITRPLIRKILVSDDDIASIITSPREWRIEQRKLLKALRTRAKESRSTMLYWP